MQDADPLRQAVHRRFDPLSGKWVLNSPHRLQRPWVGASEEPENERPPSYDPQCYLCPGNRRANGIRNPDYAGVWVFDNDFPAVLPDGEMSRHEEDPLLRLETVRGKARVICFSPDHARGLSQLDADEIAEVVRVFMEQGAELGERWAHVQLFENRGELMGCSNPHPHAQVWATAHVPDLVSAEDANQRQWLARHGQPMLQQLARRESELGERVVCANGEWIAIVPWWAQWPFETLLIPFEPCARLPELSDAAREGLADLLGRLMPALDRLFLTPFPYSMGWHGAPFTEGATNHWQVHAHIYPPLLRSASVRKFMVGYEMLAEAQRDLTSEQAAARLREVL